MSRSRYVAMLIILIALLVGVGVMSVVAIAVPGTVVEVQETR
jgi:putative effector of murein hydrolase LrgA (UPF0299 family)